MMPTDCSGHTPRCGIFTSWHIHAAYLGHTPLLAGYHSLSPKQLDRPLGATPPFRGSVRRGALPVSGSSHTSSTACQSLILAGLPQSQTQASQPKPKLGAVAFIYPFRLFGALICHADSLCSPTSQPQSPICLGNKQHLSQALSSISFSPHQRSPFLCSCLLTSM